MSGWAHRGRRTGGGPSTKAICAISGQGHEIAVELPESAVRRGRNTGRLQALFDRDVPIAASTAATIGTIAAAEVVAWRVTAGTDPHPDLDRMAEPDGEAPALATWQVLDPAFASPVGCEVYERDALGPGASVPGPAILVEDETSTVINTRFDATILPGGDVELTRRDGGRT